LEGLAKLLHLESTDIKYVIIDTSTPSANNLLPLLSPSYLYFRDVKMYGTHNEVFDSEERVIKIQK